VANVCLLREIAVQLVQKCSLKEFPDSFFHIKEASHPLHSKTSSVKSSSICGRGGESKPCTARDWDGCTPIEGVSVVDVHGIGIVKVPKVRHNVSALVDELFCLQVPGGRSLGGGAFISNKVVVLGGIGGDMKSSYRDTWARDEEFPNAIIKTKPASFSPQFTFSFDSNKDGAHVFEYKIFREGNDITGWITTTDSLGADVSWLDDKKGGPGKGWYTIYVRAVDPAGNRDSIFSTTTNVYRWYYVPPIPWGAVAGGVVTALVLIVVSYFEYRRRRRKAILERFALRRLKRKFKLREGMRRQSVTEAVPVNVHRPISRERRSAELLGDFETHRRPKSNEDIRQQQSLRRRHDGRPRSGSTSHHSRSSSKTNGKDEKPNRRERRSAASVERRRRRRRDREKNRQIYPRE
jgi:hypothetical protein